MSVFGNWRRTWSVSSETGWTGEGIWTGVMAGWAIGGGWMGRKGCGNCGRTLW